MNIEPYIYQIKGVRQIHKFGGRALLADEPGLGKTIQALLYMHRHPEINPVVVVCPASLKWNWEDEAWNHFNMRAHVLHTTQVPSSSLWVRHKLVIINYDILWSWMNYLLWLEPRLVINDECHYLANLGSRRTKAVRTLCQNVPHILCMSGTPLTNRPAELFPTLNLLRPDLFPSFFSYAHLHCGARRAPWGWVYKGATKLKSLHKKLVENLMIRRKKEDVLDELPPKVRSVVPLDLHDRKQYDFALRDFLGWLQGKDPSKIHSAQRAEGLVKIGYLKRLTAELKLKGVKEWIDNFLKSSEGKLVVFAVHKKIIYSLRKEYSKLCVVIDGDTTHKNRKLAVTKFQGDKTTRLFIGNIRAAGVGITLTAASDLTFCEFDWVPGVHTQAEDRIHRISQKGSANITYLVARDTIEEKLAKIIQAKQETLSAVLDNKEDAEGLDVFDQLLREISK